MCKFEIGDEIFHKSNSTVKWIIEKIENNEAYCTTLIKETLTQKKEIFALTSIEKCAEPRITVVRRTRSNYW